MLQTLLRSYVAVAVVWASSCRSNLTCSLDTSIGLGCGPKKDEKKKIKIKSKKHIPIKLKVRKHRGGIG